MSKSGPTDIVSFIEDNDGIFWHFLWNLLCNFRVEEVVKWIDYDIHKGKLRNQELQQVRSQVLDELLAKHAPFDGPWNKDM